MSVAASLMPAQARSSGTSHRGRPDASRPLDAVHDHVLRLLGDEHEAASVVADVAVRAAARARDLGEPLHFESLFRLAHGRMADAEHRAPDDDLVAHLAGDELPAGRVLVRAMTVPGRRGAALLDLTARHGIDLRRAAALVGVQRDTAARARTEALRQVRVHLANQGIALDVAAELARLPVVNAPDEVHRIVDVPVEERANAPVRPLLAWMGTAGVTLLTVAGLALGLPEIAAADRTSDAPVAVAVGVTDGPAVRQLSTSGDDLPADGVEELVVRPPRVQAPEDGESEATAPTAEPEPSPEASPTASPVPSPEPSDDPLQLDLLDP